MQKNKHCWPVLNIIHEPKQEQLRLLSSDKKIHRLLFYSQQFPSLLYVRNKVPNRSGEGYNFLYKYVVNYKYSMYFVDFVDLIKIILPL